jgi:hypothetical protein
MEGNKLKSDISKKPTGVFYLDGNRAFYYEQSLSSPLSTAIPPEAVSDLEVIDKKKLDIAIQAFLSTNRLVPKNIIILLSTQVTYDRDFTQSSVEMVKNIDEFLELVPFENTISKKAVFSGRTKVVAANRELCEAIKVSFQKSGFIVQGVYPLSLLLEIMPQLQSNLDLAMVIGKVPEMKDFNLIPAYDIPVNAPQKEKPNKSRLYVLGGVFGILLIVLAFFVYKNVIAPPKRVKTLPAPTLIPVPKTIKESSTSANLEVLPTEFATVGAKVTKIPVKN